jgi:hypothetical protein
MSIKGKPSSAPLPLLKNAGAAPLVYFDAVPVFGTFCGNIEIELAARMLMPKPDGSVVADMACTAHLRCSAQAAMVLIDALTKALEMLSKQQEQPSKLLDGLPSYEEHLAN